jgi:hypothetical protein
MRSLTVRLASALAIVGVGVLAWYLWAPSDERAIRRRLDAFITEFNQNATDGLGSAARAVRLGAFFADDVTVDLGQGSAPIQGREALIGMAARLQPRTAAFSLDVEDVNIEVAPGGRAEVNLTMIVRGRSSAKAEESVDAREFTLGMMNVNGDWQINRVTAIDTIR